MHTTSNAADEMIAVFLVVWYPRLMQDPTVCQWRSHDTRCALATFMLASSSSARLWRLLCLLLRP